MVSNESTPSARRAKMSASGSGLLNFVSERMPSSTAATVTKVGPSAPGIVSFTSSFELLRTSFGNASVTACVYSSGSTRTPTVPKARSGVKACFDSKCGSFTPNAVT